MKIKPLLLPLLTCLFSATVARAQGTAFTYQGRLGADGVVANGYYDLRLQLFATESNPINPFGTFTTNQVAVANGLFTVRVDFGFAWDGTDRWLEIAVKTNGAASYTTLAPRQKVTPTPYALYATSAGAAATASSAGAVLVNGVATGSLQSNAVTSDKIADGTITTAKLSPALAASTFWRLDGNAGTTPGAHFLGTADAQPLEIKVNNARVLRLEPTAGGSPNLIGGLAANSVAAGVEGATIAGGGQPGSGANAIGASGSYGTIGGGSLNKIATNAPWSAIGGGQGNSVAHRLGWVGGGAFNQAGSADGSNYLSIYNQSAVVGGGEGNQATAPYSFVGGGYNNLADKPGTVVAGGGAVYISAHSAGWWGNQAQGSSATVPGGVGNKAQGDFSFAAGMGAVAAHDGCFVWADSTALTNWTYMPTFSSSSSNQFLIRATGGVGINTTNPQAALHVVGTIQADTFVSTGSQPAIFGSVGIGTATPTDALLDVEGNMRLNDYDLFLRGGTDRNHGLGYRLNAGGSLVGGPFLYGWEGGALGTSDPDAVALKWDWNGSVWVSNILSASIMIGRYDMMVDQGDANSGSLNPGLIFGSSSGQGIASKRTAGGNQFGLDFYTASQNRMTILQNGNVGIGTTSVTRRFQVADGVGSSGSIQVGLPVPNGDAKLIYFGDGDYVHLGENGADDTMELRAARFFFTGGNLGIETNNPQYKIHVAGGAYCSGPQWVNGSDRDSKTAFTEIDPQTVLARVAALPVGGWRYKCEPDGIKHLGPMAQDFHAAFGLGDSDKAIGTVDAGGVALAAIQGLNQKVEEKDAEIQSLKARLEALEKLVSESLKK